VSTEEDLEAVLQANERFYRALSMADFNAMQRVWLASPDAICLHPGWPSLQGWPAIRASWQSIFKNQGLLRIWATDISARLYGQTAEVNCLENVDTGQVVGAALIQTRATNIFRRVGVDWKLLEHHAVPLPPHATPQAPERFSYN